MKALLLDSSDKNLTVALSENGKVVASTSYEAWQKQSEFMIQEIDAIFAKVGWDKKGIDAVISCKGPGSYTGVRIALTIAKTISFALNIPLYLVSSLEAMKDGDKPSICLMNARGKRSYFSVVNAGSENIADCIKTNAEALDFIQNHKEFSICGDAKYLGIASVSTSIADNLASSIDEAHKVEEPLGAKPIYLKDDYDAGRFKTIVRKMMPSDIPAVVEIERESFGHPYDEHQILSEMTENPVAYLYCAVVDNEVVGMIDFYITFNSATIAQIAVKPSFRSKGIGNLLIGQLLKDCESKAEPVEFITLEVRQSNERAQKFYKRHKFEVVTTKRGYYDDGEDAIYMVRSIIHG